MTDREVQRILRGIGGGAKPRPGFKQELGELLAAELEEEEPDAKGILGLIDGPVAPRPGFKAELGAVLAAELEPADRVPTPAGSAARQGGGLGRLVADRLKGSWWMQSAAAVVALAIVASGFAWNSCLQTIGPPATELAGPEAPDQANPPADFSPGPTTREDAGSGSPGTGGGGGQAPEDGASAGGPAPSGEAPAPPADAPEPVAPSEDSPEDQPPTSVTPPGPSAQPPAVLAFASKTTDGYWHIFTMHEDGTHRIQLTHGPYHDREPEWSPDGRHIAFMRIENEGDHYDNSDVYVINADGTGLRFLVEGAEPVWSPDGTQIAYTGENTSTPQLSQASSVHVVGADGSDPHPLPLPGDTAEPSWSSRDDVITFAGIFTDPTENDAQSTNLFSSRPDGSRVRRLTDNPYACNGSLSPDGRRIAYVALLDVTFDIWTMKTDGSEKRRLSSGMEFDFYPHWSPNGKRIVFGRDPDGDPHWVPGVPITGGPAPSAIWEINTDGSNLHRISPPGVEDADPVFRPRLPRRT